jgi:hypothetical protein
LPEDAEATLTALVEGPEVAPWDRKPLIVVIVSAIVLVLIGVIAGVVTVALVEPGGAAASWRNAPALAPSPPLVPLDPIDDTQPSTQSGLRSRR